MKWLIFNLRIERSLIRVFILSAKKNSFSLILLSILIYSKHHCITMLFHCITRFGKSKVVLILPEVRIEVRTLDRFLSFRATSVYS